MAPDTDSLKNEEGDGAVRWTGQVSLTPRILAVNLIAFALLAGGFFYLDSYRSRLLDSQIAQAGREARLIAEAVGEAKVKQRDELVLKLARDTGDRIRLYDPNGKLLADSKAMGLHNFALLDPDKDDWKQHVARILDGAVDTIVGAARAPLFRERSGDRGRDWPDVLGATPAIAHASVWRAPDRTPVITAAAGLPDGSAVFTAVNAREITQTVRVERFRLSVILFLVAMASILLSLFLSRSIVKPLRQLVRAAVRVRLGRAREVVVPRLPERRDEIGLLARALSDMSQALRARIDATEAFAADVTHEMKNPLASLRSAVEALDSVKKADLRARLLAIVRDDVLRLDRLITDISEASRLDAQLSRAKFEAVDVGAMLAGLLAQREERGVERGIAIRFDGPRKGDALVVLGEGARLERVFENLIDNAISFSPDNGVIAIAARRDDMDALVQVDDEGPGVPPDEREHVFRRFNSIRPETEEFGRHSGLGLAIARTIVEAHQGAINVGDREDRMTGARFSVRLPLADDREP